MCEAEQSQANRRSGVVGEERQLLCLSSGFSLCGGPSLCPVVVAHVMISGALPSHCKAAPHCCKSVSVALHFQASYRMLEIRN